MKTDIEAAWGYAAHVAYGHVGRDGEGFAPFAERLMAAWPSITVNGVAHAGYTEDEKALGQRIYDRVIAASDSSESAPYRGPCGLCRYGLRWPPTFTVSKPGDTIGDVRRRWAGHPDVLRALGL